MDQSNDSDISAIIQNYCFAFDDTRSDLLRKKVTYKVNARIFVMIASENPLVLTVKSVPERNKILLEHPNISTASYMGRFGWISIRVSDPNSLELAKDLIKQSYLIVTKQTSNCHGGYDATQF